MKIRKIELGNHPILGDLHLDFTDENGNCVDTIILAGENGTGKTSVLDLLFNFSNVIMEPNKRDEFRIFEIQFSEEEFYAQMENQSYIHHFPSRFANGICKIFFDYNYINSWEQIQFEFHKANGEKLEIPGDVLHQPEFRATMKAIYSVVEINYSSKDIKSVTAKDIDEVKPNSYKSEDNLATEITQLLIDIKALDSDDFTEWGTQNIGNKVDESKIGRRIKRFTKAFDLMFPEKKFSGIENRKGNKEVIFIENGKKMSINELSSGEKQIVFRGSFLLKDKESSKGAIILIDEPEISMHPTWQLQILDFYKTLFHNKEEYSSQLIVATHSPFIIHNPIRTNDKVIILSKNEKGIITTMLKPKFHSWTVNEIVKEAFKIDFGDTNKKSKVFVEGITDEQYLNKVKEIFNIKKLALDISWIGKVNKNGNVEFTGDSALNQAKAFFLANPDQLSTKCILYYDCDTNKPEETFENLLIRRMPKNEDNKLYAIGIENLLVLPAEFKEEKFYSEKKKTDEYGAESVIRKLDKTKLCNWICDDCSLKEQKEILKNIEPLLRKLSKEVQ
jgi:predicted ATP-dependent endonuclease of OLD family